MLDAQQLAVLVEQELRSEVKKQVQQAVSQTDWIIDLESQIVKHVQDRITARFMNISTIPDLVDTVKQSVTDMFGQGLIPGIETYINEPDIKQSVDLATEKFVEQIIDDLTIDQKWVAKIENLITQRVEQRIVARLREVDLSAALAKVVLEHKKEILHELRKDFQINGLTDVSTNNQITIMDGHVVVENELVARDLSIERDTTLKGNVLVQGSLGVQGKIAVDNDTWQELSKHVGEITYDRVKNDFALELTNNMLSTVREGIDIDNVKVDGVALISGDTLGRGIKKSSLEQIGTLSDLTVRGRADLADTLAVTKNRVGINTKDPDSALSVWDEEVSVSLGKLSKNVGFVGTSRRQNLVLGVNKQNNIEIDQEGTTTVQKLRIGRNNISWAAEIPNYSGTKGDIVFNINASAVTPFAWICLGAFRWQSLKSVQ